MKTFMIVTCLLAAAVIVRGEPPNLMENYLEYLMPHIKACGEEHKLTEEELHNVQMVPQKVDMSKLGCLRSCVMKRLNVLEGTKVNVEPVHAMIEKVHASLPDTIDSTKKIASDCALEVAGESEECTIGLKFTDCYVQKLMMGAGPN